jgi:hypothetical protein
VLGSEIGSWAISISRSRGRAEQLAFHRFVNDAVCKSKEPEAELDAQILILRYPRMKYNILSKM